MPLLVILKLRDIIITQSDEMSTQSHDAIRTAPFVDVMFPALRLEVYDTNVKFPVELPDTLPPNSLSQQNQSLQPARSKGFELFNYNHDIISIIRMKARSAVKVSQNDLGFNSLL